jgi:hypothetical protein
MIKKFKQFDAYIDYEELGFYGYDDDSKKEIPKCECGSEKVGSNLHSTWCPKHNDSGDL